MLTSVESTHYSIYTTGDSGAGGGGGAGGDNSLFGRSRAELTTVLSRVRPDCAVGNSELSEFCVSFKNQRQTNATPTAYSRVRCTVHNDYSTVARVRVCVCVPYSVLATALLYCSVSFTFPSGDEVDYLDMDPTSAPSCGVPTKDRSLYGRASVGRWPLRSVLQWTVQARSPGPCRRDHLEI